MMESMGMGMMVGMVLVCLLVVVILVLSGIALIKYLRN
ncbi:hypothetical protein GMES_4327 [Paraglaciecola mesophila KMM 241]|uniref:Oxaloacetate decarboxylase n=1 Tax=Paraglaciecola mesophila KMM 241 TaxID=1128912 RepID=K6ZC88_9ALTE|nr:hypothetical protein GMES_4327 [Paraglaciecola mesophila KMM 241]